MATGSTRGVVIAGAGPSGLLGALCLAEHDVDIEIVSPTPPDPALRRRATNGAVVLLHPGSLALLHRHGVASDVLGRAARVRAVCVYDRGERVEEVSFERLAQGAGLPFEFAACVAQADLEECLRAALRARGVVVYDQRRLARFEQGAARVRVTIDHLDSDSAGYAVAHSELVVDRSEELEPEFVLAADGHQSVVRQQLGLAFRELGTTEQYLVVEAGAVSAPPELAFVSLDEAGPSAIWPTLGGGQHGVVRLGRADEDALGLHEPAARSGAGARLRLERERLASWLARRTRGLPLGAPSELEARGPFHADHRLASGFGRGRVWLAGAAAHAASPLSSLGTNVGLSEAAQLAGIMAAALQRGVPSAAFASYEAERRQRWQRWLAPGAPEEPPSSGATDFDTLLARLTRPARPLGSPAERASAAP